MLILTSLPLLAGCSVLDTDVERGYEENTHWKASPIASVYTTADVRIVTERVRPVTGDKVMCTEPSADVAKALSTQFATAAGGGNGTASASLSTSGGSAEAAIELAGRSTALLGLRDGLYRACEAYANGAIGADAYALVLTRYGQLMTTLFLGQDITGAAGTGSHTAATSPSLSASAGGATGASGAGAKSSGAGATGASGAVGATGAEGAAAPGATGVVDKNGATGATGAIDKDGATGATGASGPTAAGATGTGSQSGGASATAALALLRMNEDYFALDNDPIHLIVTACIADGDPTRVHNGPNDYLTTLCRSLGTVGQIGVAEAAMVEIQNSLKRWPFVEPAPLASQASPKQAGPKPAPTKPTPSAKLTPTQIMDVQTELQKEQLYFGKLDGKLGPETNAAVLVYQERHQADAQPLKPTGTIDAATLKSLGVH
jgi:hypothetical protein